MSSIVPPNQVVWAEFDKNTLRATGQCRLLSPGQLSDLGPLWQKLTPMQALTYLNGTKLWNTLALIHNQAVEVDAAVDLRFLSHISTTAWPEIGLVDSKWSNVPYVPLAIPRIEPDDWDLFWKLWHEKQSDITRGLNETQFWRGLCCWLHPSIDHTKFNYSNTVVDDWSHHFPRMFEAIRSCLPFYSLEKVVLWSNINEVTPHFDPDAVVYPWPDSLRIMLWDSNEKPTFYMCRWPDRTDEFNPPAIVQRNKGAYGVNAKRIPQEQRMYVDLPIDTNSFVFNNGAFLHGADLARPKIIMAVKGRPKIYEWLRALEPSYKKYQSQIPLL